MSKTQDKRLQRRIESAEYLWNQSQIKAASAQSVLDYMVQYYEERKNELDSEIVAKTEEQIALRKKELEEFLMGAKADYEKEIGEYNGTL